MLSRFAILGADGDLTSRLLMPALADLMHQRDLPKDFEVIGVGLGDYSTATFKARLAEGLKTFAPHIPKEVQEQLVGCSSYVQGDVTDAKVLKRALQPQQGPLVVYLALPAPIFTPALKAVAEAGVSADSRIVIEKPYGVDYKDVKALNALIHQSYPETTVYRMDHFLGKQTVQNVLGLRFANHFFEPLWNREHIEKIDVIWDENLSLEGRASYYDRAGALRDMIQNHLLQILCLLAMEVPESLEEKDLRNAKVEVLKAIPYLTLEAIKKKTIRARYVAGELEGKGVPSYEDEQGVDPKRDTETFAQITLQVANARWQGVPFTLRSGKALPKREPTAIITFKQVPDYKLWQGRPPRRNKLILRFKPDGLSLNINLNGEGDPFDIEQVSLGLELLPQDKTAYARLLENILKGDPVLSIRADEAEETWRIITPILEAWQQGEVAMQSYPAGQRFSPKIG